VVRLETTDFVTYSEPEVVLTPPTELKWWGPIWAESVVRKPDGSEYLLKARCHWKPWHGMFYFRSVDGRTWTPCRGMEPSYTDHDACFLFWDNANSRYAVSQTSYLDGDWRRTPPDLLGDRWRRCLTIRTSKDGATWDPDLNVSKETMHPPSFLRTPDEEDPEDPEDLEYYYMQVFPWGDRYAAMLLTYAASPPEANPYLVDLGVKGFRDFRGPSDHGAHVGTEWWVADDPTDIHSWRRPYRETEAAPFGFHLHHNPVEFDGRLIWFFCYKRQWYRNEEARNHVLGLPAGRIAGAFARSNGAFSTYPFVVPDEKVTLNASCSFVGDKALPSERQSYVMVSVLDAEDRVIEGFEAERCLFRDADDTKLNLDWDGKTLKEMVGERVSLRIQLRNSTVYGVGAD